MGNKHLAKRMCAAALAATLLAVMTLSVVAPLQVLIIVGASLATIVVIMAVTSRTYDYHTRAGPRTDSNRITAFGQLTVILGMAAGAAWPDPDQLCHNTHKLGNHSAAKRSHAELFARLYAAFLGATTFFNRTQVEHNAYNARDQGAKVLNHQFSDSTAAPLCRCIRPKFHLPNTGMIAVCAAT